jgi:hypothetical protein
MRGGFISKRRKCPKGWKKRSVRIKGRGVRYLCKRR